MAIRWVLIIFGKDVCVVGFFYGIKGSFKVFAQRAC
jgi:hypothetical protein